MVPLTMPSTDPESLGKLVPIQEMYVRTDICVLRNESTSKRVVQASDGKPSGSLQWYL